jgi:hypothetical protein
MSEVGNQVVSPPQGHDAVPRAEMGTMQFSQGGVEGVVEGRWALLGVPSL